MSIVSPDFISQNTTYSIYYGFANCVRPIRHIMSTFTQSVMLTWITLINSLFCWEAPGGGGTGIGFSPWFVWIPYSQHTGQF